MEHAPCQIDTCLERKHGRFVGVGGDGHNDAVEQAGRPTHEVVVAICNRIESAWIQRTAKAVHSLLSPLFHWKKSPAALFRTSALLSPAKSAVFAGCVASQRKSERLLA